MLPAPMSALGDLLVQVRFQGQPRRRKVEPDREGRVARPCSAHGPHAVRVRVVDGAAALLVPARALGEGRVRLHGHTEYCGVARVLNIGPGGICRHDCRHNRHIKNSSVMPGTRSIFSGFGRFRGACGPFLAFFGILPACLWQSVRTAGIVGHHPSVKG